MGATGFDTTIYTDSGMKAAYKEACAEALYEEGHESSNGTISTTRGVQLSPLSSTPVPEDQIDLAAISERLNHLEPRGVCEALPIRALTAGKYKPLGSATVEARVPAAALAPATPWHEQQRMFAEAFLRVVRKKVKQGEAVIVPSSGQNTVTVDPGNVSALTASEVAGTPLPGAQTATTHVTPGRKETRYFVMEPHRLAMPRWESGYPTLAEARAALPATNPSRVRAVYTCEVIAMTRRVTGEPLLQHQVGPKEGPKTLPVSLTGVVRLCLEKPRLSDRTGWHFYGWAAC